MTVTIDSAGWTIITSDCPYCNIDTAGSHQIHCPSFGLDDRMLYTASSHKRHGWLCPRCGKSLAPWVRECGCEPNDIRILPRYTNGK